jgi:hypothetical protein
MEKREKKDNSNYSLSLFFSKRRAAFLCIKKKKRRNYGLSLKSVLVTKEEMVEEDGDLQLC